MKRSLEQTDETPTQDSKLAKKKDDRWDSIIKAAELFVKEELKGNDGSHDWFHIDRVRTLALSLAEEEQITNLDVVELAALLHDIRDWKYSGSETAGIEAVQEFLARHLYPEEKTKQVLFIIENIGFKTELGKKNLEITPELAVVQDADRLDAIGAIGIARTFAYGGAHKRALWDPAEEKLENITKTEYMKRESSTLDHFYVKLLRLKDMMKSNAGKKRAVKRHAVLEEFIKQFKDEWNGIS